jgi:hypothetical protein
MQVARLTFEFLRPVPIGLLTVSAAIRRPGRKVQFADAALSCDGVEVARVSALRIRVGEVDVPPPGDPPPPPPSAVDDPVLNLGRPWFGDAFNFRTASGQVWAEPGPCALWARLVLPLVGGETPSPLVRVVALADFGNGVSRALDFTRHLFINPDLTVSLHRPARSDWILLDAVSRYQRSGIGLASAEISDLEGHVGRSQQSLLVDLL